MLVLVGPSASGKSAIVKNLIKNYGLEKFITCTTRSMRVGEINGVDYYFLSNEEFSSSYEKNEFIAEFFRIVDSFEMANFGEGRSVVDFKAKYGY